MKLYFGESKADYSRYTFPYQVWLLKEEGDDLEKIYDLGFLPIRNLLNVFYLSRNIRINLEQFELSSENRRVLRKTERFTSKLFALSDFTYSAQVQKFCADYTKERFGEGVLSTAAIKNIFTSKVYNSVLVFQDEAQEPVGYAVCYLSDNLLQYAHPFYEMKYFKENLGARMMLEAITLAKETGKKYVYLGTCYEKQALYKTEFKGVEFFNGLGWSGNLEELKYLINKDSDKILFKDPEYLLRFHNDLHKLLGNFGVRVKI